MLFVTKNALEGKIVLWADELHGLIVEFSCQYFYSTNFICVYLYVSVVSSQIGALYQPSIRLTSASSNFKALAILLTGSPCSNMPIAAS